MRVAKKNRRGVYFRGYVFSRARKVRGIAKKRGYFVVRGYFVAIPNVAIFRGYFRGYSWLFLVFPWLFVRGYFLRVAILL